MGKADYYSRFLRCIQQQIPFRMLVFGVGAVLSCLCLAGWRRGWRGHLIDGRALGCGRSCRKNESAVSVSSFGGWVEAVRSLWLDCFGLNGGLSVNAEEKT